MKNGNYREPDQAAVIERLRKDVEILKKRLQSLEDAHTLSDVPPRFWPIVMSCAAVVCTLITAGLQEMGSVSFMSAFTVITIFVWIGMIVLWVSFVFRFIARNEGTS